MRVGRPVVHLARQTLTGGLRSPLVAATVSLTVGLAGVAPCLDYLGFLDKRQLVLDSLLALFLWGGLILAALGGRDAVGEELRSGALALILARPVNRASWLVGRTLGLALLLAIYWPIAAAAVLWASRIALQPFRPDDLAARIWCGVWVAALLLGGLTWRRWAGAGVTVALALLLPAGLLALGGVGYRGAPGSGWGLVAWEQWLAAALLYPAWLLGLAVAVVLHLLLEPGPALIGFGLVVAGGLVTGAASGPVVGLWPAFGSLWVGDRLAELTLGEAGRLALAAVCQTAALLLLAGVWLDRRELV